MGEAEALLLPVDTLFEQYPALTLDAEQERRCRAGNAFPFAGAEDGRVRLYASGGEFLALGEVKSGELRTVKSFFETVDT